MRLELRDQRSRIAHAALQYAPDVTVAVCNANDAGAVRDRQTGAFL
jgi:hypothetical protein